MGSLLYLPIILTVATSWLYLLTTLLPDSEYSDRLKENLRFPNNLDDLRELAGLLSIFKAQHPYYVFTLFSSAYLYKQSFAIPGSVFLNVLGGALYGPVWGVVICCLLTSVGATGCYLLSLVSGKDAVIKYFPQKISQLQHQIDVNRRRLPYFLLSLRLIPVSPNWFINVASPVLGIPLPVFMVTALIGLFPYNTMCVQAGSVLSQLTSLSDLLSFGNVLKFSTIALVAALPGFLVKKLDNEKQL